MMIQILSDLLIVSLNQWETLGGRGGGLAPNNATPQYIEIIYLGLLIILSRPPQIYVDVSATGLNYMRGEWPSGPASSISLTEVKHGCVRSETRWATFQMNDQNSSLSRPSEGTLN